MSGWGTALRMARRDALRHPGRSLLVMTLIALPVLAVSAADVVIRSGIPTPDEQAGAELAGADAWIMAPQGVTDFRQTWSGMSTWLFDHAGTGISGQGLVTVAGPSDNAAPADGETVELIPVDDRPARPAAEVLPLLPPGSAITPWRHITEFPVAAADGHYLSVAADLLDITDPASGGRYAVVAGAAPSGPGQVALTTHLAARLGVSVGDTVLAGAPTARATVVGTVRAAASGNSAVPLADFDAVVAVPDGVEVTDAVASGPRYLVTSDVPFTLDLIQRLNEKGIGAFSRAGAVEMAAMSNGNPNDAAAELALVAVAAVLVGLQIVILAGPAFAIGAKRIRRELGQLVAAGASPAQVRAAVLGTGVVLGAGGALLGLLAGIGLGVAARSLLLALLPGYTSPGIHVHLPELLAVAALGFAASLLAALAPARRMGRTPALALLGRQPAGLAPVRWWSLAGAVLAAAGVAVTVRYGTREIPPNSGVSVASSRGYGLALGAAMVEIGLLLAVPLLIRWASTAGRLLPVAGRLALRDVDRRRGRTAPAVAAVAAGMTLAVIAAVAYASAGSSAAEHYRAGIPAGEVVVALADPPPGEPADPAAADGMDQVIAAQWPGAAVAGYGSVEAQQRFDPALQVVADAPPGGFRQRGLLVPPENVCPYGEVNGQLQHQLVGTGEDIDPSGGDAPSPDPDQLATAATDWRCFGRSYSSLTAEEAGVHRWPVAKRGSVSSAVRMGTILVGGADLRQLLTGVDDPAADAALESGGAVVLDRTYLSAEGTVCSASQDDAHQGEMGRLLLQDVRCVPAVAGAWSPTPLGVILSPEAARALGWRPAPAGAVMRPEQLVTQAEADDLTVALRAGGVSAFSARVEPGAPVDAGATTRTAMTVMLLILGGLIAATIIVVTALGLSDARAPLATLAAVGAAPRIRRLMTGWTALTVGLLGCLVGGVVGLVPAWGILRLLQAVSGPSADHIVVPWASLLLALVVVPAVSFVIGALLTRSRLPLVARAD